MVRTLSAILLLTTACGLSAADPVVSVPSADQVVVAYYDLPVLMTLAHVEVPAEQRDAAHARLKSLLEGKEVNVIYKKEFGVDANGAARVHIKAGNDHANNILVSEGLARYQPSEGDTSAFARILKMSESKAEADKAGLWGQPVVVATADTKPDVTPTPVVQDKPVVPAARPAKKGPFCAELSGTYFYASDDPRVKQLNAGNLIFYNSKDAAKRAGKRLAPEAVSASVGSGGEAEADQLLAEGKDIYSQAIAAGNTTKRDDLYGESFAKFTAAMQIYSGLVDAAPNDAALAEKLRETMQLRYGAMKQRRF